MDLAGLRSQVVAITGYPERGTVGQERLNSSINYSLRQLWREMPEALMKEEFRLRLEPPISKNTITIDAYNPLVFGIATTGLTDTSFAVDGTLSARWLEVEKDGRYIYRRIQSIYWRTDVEQWKIIIDKPWENLSDSNLTYRIFTKEYPYPSDVQKIRKIMYDPENSSHKITYSLFADELYDWRLSHGFRDSGVPRRAARGDFFTLPSPHYKPKVSLVTPDQELDPINSDLWGHKAADGSTEPDYGPAGTFSYKVVHVWGRRPLLDPSHKRPTATIAANEVKGTLLPFYVSSPSEASDQVTSYWGKGVIKIVTPDIDYMNGYGQESALSDLSYHKSGIEKWIFRARHATDTDGTNHKDVEADGVYYLWNIVKGYEATKADTTFDRGADDPVDKTIPLKDVHGHFHIRFDSYPDTAADVLMSIIRRPDTLKYDTDVSRVPPECYGALVDLTCSYLLGRRDGEPKRESYYYARYMEEVDRLRGLYTFSGFQDPAFGDGLHPSPSQEGRNYEVKEG